MTTDYSPKNTLASEEEWTPRGRYAKATINHSATLLRPLPRGAFVPKLQLRNALVPEAPLRKPPACARWQRARRVRAAANINRNQEPSTKNQELPPIRPSPTDHSLHPSS